MNDTGLDWYPTTAAGAKCKCRIAAAYHCKPCNLLLQHQSCETHVWSLLRSSAGGSAAAGEDMKSWRLQKNRRGFGT